MKLGLLTACLPSLTLAESAAWAAGAGYRALEVAAWPKGGSHLHHAAHLDVVDFSGADVDRVHALLDRHGLTVPAVTYCDNNLHGDPARRERVHRHLRACVDAAAALGVPYVTTFVGRDVTRSVAQNVALAERILPPLLAYAGERGVRLLAENCPMEGWHPDGYPGNLAYSPELWEWMADLGGRGAGFLLAYDPSHLPWLGIDPVAALDQALARGAVAHVQAKDVEIDGAARTRYGVFGKTVGRRGPTDVGWWRYRVPGRGSLDWRRLLDRLRRAGYAGTVAVEHEDPVWGGTVERTKEGLKIAAEHLRPLVTGKPQA
ncbi:sugar phosphate isomerase/epimerase family protein [Streptomyces sp. NPDC047315]|uniref:sugar phosphate isomerase/epimerase family protein n=1 Tax=Streptomyces sp. NPDC047315 TaxID=3155142 RepID=UPI0033C82166